MVHRRILPWVVPVADMPRRSRNASPSAKFVTQKRLSVTAAGHRKTLAMVIANTPMARRAQAQSQMSKTHSDRTTDCPSAVPLEPVVKAAGSKAKGSELETSVTDPKIARLVQWLKAVNVPLHPEKLAADKAQGAQLDDDGRPGKSRERSVWDTVRRSGTAIVAQTANFDKLPFKSTMLDMATALQGLSIRDTAYHAWVAVRRTLDNRSHGNPKPDCMDPNSLQKLDVNEVAAEAAELYLLELGVALTDTIDGLHFMFLDPSLCSRIDMVSHARRMIDLYESRGVARERLVVTIPASAEGLATAQTLEKEHGIATNLCLVSGFFHAVLCVEAGASYITFSCKHLNAMQPPQISTRKRTLATQQSPEYYWLAEVQAAVEYLTLHDCKAKSMLVDLCGKYSPELLGGVDAICLRDDKELERLDRAQPMARQVRYPTAYLAESNGFLSGTNLQTRLRATSVLRRGLTEMRRAKKDLITRMSEEVRRQVKLLQLDATSLADMYRQDLLVEQQMPVFGSSHQQRQNPRAGQRHSAAHNPRANHVGYRIAEMRWDKPERSPSPPIDIYSDRLEHDLSHYIAAVAKSAPRDPTDARSNDALSRRHSGSRSSSNARVSRLLKSHTAGRNPAPGADGSKRRRDDDDDDIEVF
ncbi:hypothetical protein BC835DRAFT_1303536 [Cytidiella melzeri]|nr:hypothetical protein BC835DRAFT_1303536 [Cytidiella melzeri]